MLTFMRVHIFRVVRKYIRKFEHFVKVPLLKIDLFFVDVTTSIKQVLY